MEYIWMYISKISFISVFFNIIYVRVRLIEQGGSYRVILCK